MRNNKPAYKHMTKDYYLFYAGWWKVDTGAIYNSFDTNARGFIRSEMDVAQPDLVNPGNWRYYYDHMDHSTISVTTTTIIAPTTSTTTTTTPTTTTTATTTREPEPG